MFRESSDINAHKWHGYDYIFHENHGGERIKNIRMYAWKRMNEQKQNGKLGIDVKMNASESPMMLLLRLLLLRRLQIKLRLR